MSAPDIDRLLASALSSLDLASALGSGAARHASAILRGARGAGRPAFDDAAAVAEMRRLIAAGSGRNAAMIAARRFAADPRAAAALARRLRRKN
jgi:hypothetical protein